MIPRRQRCESWLLRLWRDEDGQSTTEYILTVALAVAIMTGVTDIIKRVMRSVMEVIMETIARPWP